MRWRDVGLGLYEGWGRTLLIGMLSGVGIEMMELFCTQPLLAHLTGQMPDLSAFDRVTGNVKWLMMSLAFTWTLFAFGEEFIFRGYLINRIADLVGRARSSWGVALVLASAIFGLSHFMQGITGVSENFIDGIILGALYLRSTLSDVWAQIGGPDHCPWRYGYSGLLADFLSPLSGIALNCKCLIEHSEHSTWPKSRHLVHLPTRDSRRGPTECQISD
jgi:hypothetical protein